MFSVILFVVFFSVYSVLLNRVSEQKGYQDAQDYYNQLFEEMEEEERMYEALYPIEQPVEDPTFLLLSESEAEGDVEYTGHVSYTLSQMGIRELRKIANGKVKGFMRLSKDQLIDSLMAL